MLTIVVKAQFITASNADALTNAPNIENTGNAVEEFWYHPLNLVVGDMRVSVCDGSTPTLVWALEPNQGAPGGMLFTSGSLFLPSGINDPDIDLGEKGQNAMLVYTSGGNIILSSYRFDIAQNGFNLVSGPTVIGQGENPNLNVYSYDGTVFYTVITWQDGNSIKACKSGGTASNFSKPIVVNAQNTGNAFAKPDVTIKGTGINTTTGLVGPMLASFTYIESSQTDGHNLVVQQELVTDIINNTLAYNFISLGLPWISVDEEYGHPRIASPWSFSLPFTGNFYDFSVVVDHTNGSEYWIESVTSNGGLLSSSANEPIPINYSNGNVNVPVSSAIQPQFVTSPSSNLNPAIDYCGDNIVVAWQYFDDVGNIPAGTNTFEVLQRKLDLIGVPVLPIYSVVNLSSAGAQEYVSVAGRYSTQSKVLYTFSTLNSSLAEKYSGIGNISLRLPRVIYMGVYPNPFHNQVQVCLEEGGNNIKIYDLNSRLVYEYFSNSHSFNLDLRFLPQGLYFLQIQNVNGIQTKKIEKI